MSKNGNELMTDECPDCAGEGQYETDEFSPGRRDGYYSRAHSCRKCDGSGELTTTLYEWELIYSERQGEELARIKRQLQAANERIVELTKQLRAARVGGDASSAVPTGDSPATTEASAPTPPPSVNVPAETQGMASTLPVGFDNDDSLIGFGI